jgi:hypothetical protein
MSNKRKRDVISFRIRSIDADLREAIDGMDAAAISEACRNGLRLMLGKTKAPVVSVTEREIERLKQPPKTSQPAQPPKVFRPPTS